jgi:hypothetical protein
MMPKGRSRNLSHPIEEIAMRYLVAAMMFLAAFAVVPGWATAGPLTKPPKLEKMIKSPVHKKDKAPGASYTGQQGGGHKIFHRGG